MSSVTSKQIQAEKLTVSLCGRIEYQKQLLMKAGFREFMNYIYLSEKDYTILHNAFVERMAIDQEVEYFCGCKILSTSADRTEIVVGVKC